MKNFWKVIEMNEAILERRLEYYDKSTGEKISSLVRIYPTRLVIKRGDTTESISIPYINVLRYYRDPAWGYLIAGIIFLFISLIIYLLPEDLKIPMVSFILESPFKEILIAIFLILGIFSIILWYYLQSFILSIYSFGYTLQLHSRNETPIKEVFETLERIREEIHRK